MFLRLTRELIDIPSVTGEELAVGEYLSEYLERLGYRVEKQEIDAGSIQCACHY